MTNKVRILTLAIIVFILLGILQKTLLRNDTFLFWNGGEKAYLVLSKIFQKTHSYSEKISLWVKQKEETYQEDVFFSRAKRPLEKKILIVTFSLNDTGAPLMFLQLARLLHQKGYHVSLLSYAGGRHEEDLKKENIPYLISKKFFNGSAEVEELLSSFDVVISGRIPKMHFPNQEYKFIWWDHGLSECPKTKKRVKGVDPAKDVEFLISDAQDVVFVSELQQKKLAKCRQLPSEVIHNGISLTGEDLNSSVAWQIRKAKKDGKTVFISVGYIDSIKGQDILVNAVKLLPAKYRKKTAFFIIGLERNEKYAGSLREKSKDMPEIVWTGEVPHEKIGGIYKSADILLVPSRSDTAPLVVQEAAEHQMPAVITDNVGATNIVEDGKSGFIIPVENAKTLAAKIRFLTDNPDKIKEFGKVARQNYEAYSSLDTFIANWEDKINRKLREIKR